MSDNQIPLMRKDVDLSDLFTWFKGVRGIDLSKAMQTAMITPTMEGASTINVTVVDHDRQLLQSGKLSSRQEIKVDDLWFVLAAVNKQGKVLRLTFEDRIIYWLRKYSSPIKQSGSTSRGTHTRAQFILRMLQEVTEGTIPYFIPELKTVQPLDTQEKVDGNKQLQPANKSQGIPEHNDLDVGEGPMTEEQRANANTILTVGTSTGRTVKLLIISMMVAIQESRLKNLDYGKPGDFNYLSADNNNNPVGVFQQIKSDGWPATRDVGKDSVGFFNAADQYAVSDLQYYQIAGKIQCPHCGESFNRAYAQWRHQAERIVTAFGEGIVSDNNSQFPDFSLTGDYEFYRGIPPTSVNRKQKYGSRWGPETSWDCMNRLAAEVQKRVFVTGGVFYYISDEDLFKSEPVATLDELTKGVYSIDGDCDEGKKNGTVTVKCRMGRWSAPPGSVVQLRNMGPWNGRWLVSNARRPATSPDGEILLKKPLPKLPEPSGTNIINTSGSTTWTGFPPVPPPGQTERYIFPIPGNVDWWESRIDMGKDLETGTPGVGWPLLAIGNGTIARISDGGGFGPWYMVLLLDDDWRIPRKTHPVPADATPGGGFTGGMALNAGRAIFYGHCAQPIASVGQSVRAGEPIIHIKGVGEGGAPLSSPGHMEIGWAVPSAGSNYTMLAYSHYKENNHTPEGYDFWEFLQSIKNNTVTLPLTARLL